MVFTKKKILIASSKPLNLQTIGNILTSHGYETISTDKGREVFEILKKKLPDVVLLDVILSDMNGFDVCMLIKKHERYKIIPVLMLTTLTDNNERIKVLQAEADGFIFKPFNENEIIATIKKFIKIKEFNELLYGSMNNILVIADHSKKVIDRFEPLRFDFSLNLDMLVGNIARDLSDNIDKPANIIVGFKELGKWKAFHYEYVFLQLKRYEIKFDIEKVFKLPEKERTLIITYNKRDTLNEEIKRFIDEMETFKIVVSNFTGYIDSDFYLFALNYGRDVTEYDAEVIRILITQCLFFKTIAKQIQRLDEVVTYSVYTLARASEANDEDPKKHMLRIGEYSALISKNLGMDEKFIRKIKIQSALHDVGKIYISSDILRKNMKLTDEEWEKVKQHTTYGWQIIGGHPYFSMARNIAMYHHERWDGTGYPKGLKGEQIPLEARIVSLADIYDTLRMDRPYRKGFNHDTVFKIITEGDGRTMPSHFDPKILKIFKENHSKFDHIYESMKD